MEVNIMEIKYGKFLAAGLLLLTIAGCSKERPTLTQDEIQQNKARMQANEKETQERK